MIDKIDKIDKIVKINKIEDDTKLAEILENGLKEYESISGGGRKRCSIRRRRKSLRYGRMKRKSRRYRKY